MLTSGRSPADVIRRVALQEGVDPNILLSIWQQESSGSTDLGLRGKTLDSGHYARGPFQIMSFHGEIPNDFEGQARWAARHLKERGVRGYYGTGKAPAGDPTTDEYEAQVMRRAGKPLQVAQAGRADVPQGLLSQPQPITQQEVPMYEEEIPQPTGIEELMRSPLFLMGASMLAGAGGESGAVGQGLMRGIGGYQAQQSNNSLQDYRREQIMAARARQQEAERQRAMQQRFMELVASGIGPEAALQGAGADLGQLGVMGALMGIEGAGKLVDYSNARLPYGQMTQADRANVGIREREARLKEAEAADRGIGAPTAAPQAGISAAQQREIAAEAGKAEAKKRAEARVDLPKAEATAAQTLQTIDDLIAHPGRTWATGSFVGRLPALPGDAYDFKAKLDMAKGQVFLRAYETLKGGGQITQIEGEKAEKAMAALDRAQSEDAFLKGLKDLREAVDAGQRKLRESAGVQGSMEGPASSGVVDYRWSNGRLVPAR